MEWIKELLTLFWDYLKFWVLVNHYEEAIVLRGGKYLKTLGPGLYLKWPFIDYSLEVYVMPDTMDVEPISITTGDGKTVTIGLMVEYKVMDTKKYKIETNDSPTNMKDLARGEMSDYLEDLNWEDIKKKTTKNALRRKLQEHYTEMGVEIIELKFTHKAESSVFRFFTDKQNNINAI